MGVEEEALWCAEAIQPMFDSLCENARAAGWSDMAIGRAALKLATRQLKDAFDAR